MNAISRQTIQTVSISCFFFVCAALRLPCTPLQAQVSEPEIVLDLTVNAVLPPRPNDWGRSPDHIVLTITNRTQDLLPARVDIQVRDADTILARARLFSVPMLQIPPGIMTYTAEHLAASMELEYYRQTENQLQPNTELPPGTYTLCLRLVDQDGSDALSLPICRPFTVHGALRPSLRWPGEIVDITHEFDETMEFRWELPYTVAPAPSKWLLRVVDADVVQGGDSLALLTSTVVLERIVQDSTSYHLTNPGTFFETNRRYLWSVRPFDREYPLDQKGWAVPLSFTVLPAPAQQQRNER